MSSSQPIRCAMKGDAGEHLCLKAVSSVLHGLGHPSPQPLALCRAHMGSEGPDGVEILDATPEFRAMAGLPETPVPGRAETLDQTALKGLLTCLDRICAADWRGVQPVTMARGDDAPPMQGACIPIRSPLFCLLLSERMEDSLDMACWRLPLHLFLSQNPVAQAFKDVEGRYLFINGPGRDALRLIGARGHFLGRTDEAIFDKAIAEHFMSMDRQVLDTGRPSSTETVFGHGRDRQVRLVTKYPVRDAEGEAIGVGVVSMDITARKNAERATLASLEEVHYYQEKLQAVFNTITEGIITFDHRLRVMDLNPASHGICSVTHTLSPGSSMDMRAAPCGCRCLDVARHVLETGKPVVEFRIQCRTPRGRQRAVVVNASPLHIPDEQSPGVLLTLRDVSRMESDAAALPQRYEYRGMIGRSSRMQHIYATLERLAHLDTTVLILGESGTGKELVVEAIHNAGSRAHKPLVKVNCSALSEHLLESELFGHVQGAYTGATSDKAGRFELADGGSVFLDEVGDISPTVQLKLLRFLESHEFERVGEASTRRVDVRVMAATNADLEAKVRRGEFRADLFYRLRVMVIELPPLRDRPEDIPLLLDHFIERFRPAINTSVLGLSDEAIRCMMRYPWPGNIRQLKHAVESAFVVCSDPVIDVHHLPSEVHSGCDEKDSRTAATPDGAHQGQDPERRRILQALEAEHWNKSRTAIRLGISRKTLYRKLDRHGIG